MFPGAAMMIRAKVKARAGVRGFTLLEVLMALAVAAVIIAATSTAMLRSQDVHIRVTDRIQSLWVAKNLLEEMKVTHAWVAPRNYEGEADLGDRKWWYVNEVSNTSDPDIRKVVVKVFAEESRKREAARLIGALVNDAAVAAPRLIARPAGSASPGQAAPTGPAAPSTPGARTPGGK